MFCNPSVGLGLDWKRPSSSPLCPLLLSLYEGKGTQGFRTWELRTFHQRILPHNCQEEKTSAAQTSPIWCSRWWCWKLSFGKVLGCVGIWVQYWFSWCSRLSPRMLLMASFVHSDAVPTCWHGYLLRIGFPHCWLTVGCQLNSQSSSSTSSFTDLRQNSFVPYCITSSTENVPFMVFSWLQFLAVQGLSLWRPVTWLWPLENSAFPFLAWRVPLNTGDLSTSVWSFPSTCCLLKKLTIP